jgi:hypothetical protein
MKTNSTNAWRLSNVSGTLAGITTTIDSEKSVPDIWKTVIKAHLAVMAAREGNIFTVNAFMQTVGTQDILHFSVQQKTVNL